MEKRRENGNGDSTSKAPLGFANGAVAVVKEQPEGSCRKANLPEIHKMLKAGEGSTEVRCVVANSATVENNVSSTSWEGNSLN